MDMSTLQSNFQDLTIGKTACVRVEVKLESGLLIKTLAELMYDEFQRMAPYAEYKPLEHLDSEMLRKYFNTLLWMRVNAVNQITNKSTAMYNRLSRTAAVPVLFSHVLIGVGIAYDKDFNLEFYPAYNPSQDEILSPEQLLMVSDLFRQFENSGMKIVFGLPRALDGELDYMAMSNVASEVRSYRYTHPVYGFLAAFTAQQELNQITGSMSRVFYGYETDYAMRLRVLIAKINHAI